MIDWTSTPAEPLPFFVCVFVFTFGFVCLLAAALARVLRDGVDAPAETLRRHGMPHTAAVSVVFLLFLCFGLATMSFCFLVSTLFSHARTASIVGMVLYFLMRVSSAAFSH